MTIGERIKSLRIGANMSQQELADELGVAKQTVFKYENGIVTNIPSDKIEIMAKLFGVTPQYIMGWEIQEEDILKKAISEMNAVKAKKKPKVSKRFKKEMTQIYVTPSDKILLDGIKNLSEEKRKILLSSLGISESPSKLSVNSALNRKLPDISSSPRAIEIQGAAHPRQGKIRTPIRKLKKAKI